MFSVLQSRNVLCQLALKVVQFCVLLHIKNNPDEYPELQLFICLHLPQVCLSCASDHNHHGDIEEGQEEDGEEEEDDEGDLVDWVPLKQKAGKKHCQRHNGPRVLTL